MTVASVLPECLTIPVRKKLYFVSFSNILSSKSSIYNVRYIFIDAPVKIKINLYVRSISRIDDVKMVIKCIQNLLHVFLDVSNIKTVFFPEIDFYFIKLNVIQSCVCISKCIQCILGGDIHTTPTIVRINTFLRSIDKIDDYKMVSQKKIAPIHFEHILYCNMKYKCVIITQLVFYLYYES